jgi:mannose-6-phosphate isomerase-like protein (cupin superfamily)
MTKEDELFLVVDGRFKMELRDRKVWIEEGEFIVVPAGSSTGRSQRRSACCCSSRRRR